MDKLILDHNLEKLHQELAKIKSPFLRAVDYLRALKSLYQLMVSKTLSEDYPDVIDRFRDLFDEMYDVKLINFTPKIHMMYHHLGKHSKKNRI